MASLVPGERIIERCYFFANAGAANSSHARPEAAVLQPAPTALATAPRRPRPSSMAGSFAWRVKPSVWISIDLPLCQWMKDRRGAQVPCGLPGAIGELKPRLCEPQ
jgi:hypothetical protein